MRSLGATGDQNITDAINFRLTFIPVVRILLKRVSGWGKVPALNCERPRANSVFIGIGHRIIDFFPHMLRDNHRAGQIRQSIHRFRLVQSDTNFRIAEDLGRASKATGIQSLVGIKEVECVCNIFGSVRFAVRPLFTVTNRYINSFRIVTDSVGFTH